MPLVPASLFITPSFTLKSVPVWTLHYKITLFMEEGSEEDTAVSNELSLSWFLLGIFFLWAGMVFTDFPKCSGKLWQASHVHSIVSSCCSEQTFPTHTGPVHCLSLGWGLADGDTGKQHIRPLWSEHIFLAWFLTTVCTGWEVGATLGTYRRENLETEHTVLLNSHSCESQAL